MFKEKVIKTSEYDIQCSIVHHLRLKNIMFFSVPNGIFFNSKSKKQGFSYMNKLKNAGFLNGVSDLIILLPNRTIFVEIKTAKGKQNINQIEFEKDVKKLGFKYLIWRTLEDCIIWEKEYRERERNSIF